MATDSLYSDFSLDLIPNPVTGDIPTKKNESAVKSALINLMRTPIGSRPFDPEYGTNLDKFLFELADPITESLINDSLAASIKRFEPRVQLISIESKMEDYGISIIISYYVHNVPAAQTLETTITRS